MATAIFPSSYRCDCGHELHFSYEEYAKVVRLRQAERKRQALASIRQMREQVQALNEGISAGSILQGKTATGR